MNMLSEQEDQSKKIDEDLRDDEQVIGWLRPDPRCRLLPAWALGVALVLTGSSVCALFFWGDHRSMTNEGEEIRVLLLIFGLLSVLAGMLTMVISAFQVLQDERSITFLSNGIIYRDIRGKKHKILWHHLESIEIMDQGLLMCLVDQVKITMRLDWLSVQPADLQNKLFEIQRRALLGVTQDISTLLTELKLNLALGGQSKQSVSGKP